MSADKIKCEECGNDGTAGSLYLTIDAKWRDGVWTLEEREDEGGGELDCLECDHRTEAPEGIFPYGMTFKLGRMAAIMVPNLAERVMDIINVGTGNKERDAALAGAKLEDIKRLIEGGE